MRSLRRENFEKLKHTQSSEYKRLERRKNPQYKRFTTRFIFSGNDIKYFVRKMAIIQTNHLQLSWVVVVQPECSCGNDGDDKNYCNDIFHLMHLWYSNFMLPSNFYVLQETKKFRIVLMWKLKRDSQKSSFQFSKKNLKNSIEWLFEQSFKITFLKVVSIFRLTNI